MGYTRKDRMFNGMWPKSSKKFGGRMERHVLKLGFGLGTSLLDGLSSAANGISVPIVPVHVLPLEERKANKKSVWISCLCLGLMLIFQVLSYLSYVRWGWWPFFSLLLFSTLALLSLWAAKLDLDYSEGLNWKTYKWLCVIITITAAAFVLLNLWPLLIKTFITTFTGILLSFQLVGAVVFVVNTWKDYRSKTV